MSQKKFVFISWLILPVLLTTFGYNAKLFGDLEWQDEFLKCLAICLLFYLFLFLISPKIETYLEQQVKTYQPILMGGIQSLMVVFVQLFFNLSDFHLVSKLLVIWAWVIILQVLALNNKNKEEIPPPLPPNNQNESNEKETMLLKNKILLNELLQNKVQKPQTSLRTINGIGSSLMGRFVIDQANSLYIKAEVVCVFFIPIFIADWYLVKEISGTSNIFLSRITGHTLRKIEPSVIKRYTNVLGSGVFRLFIFIFVIAIVIFLITLLRYLFH